MNRRHVPYRPTLNGKTLWRYTAYRQQIVYNVWIGDTVRGTVQLRTVTGITVSWLWRSVIVLVKRCVVQYRMRLSWVKNGEGYRVSEYKIIPQVCPGETEENNEVTLSIACLSTQHVSENVFIQSRNANRSKPSTNRKTCGSPCTCVIMCWLMSVYACTSI